MNNLQFFLICTISILLLIGGARGFATVHAPEREKCLKAGYEWSSTKYVCVVKPK